MSEHISMNRTRDRNSAWQCVSIGILLSFAGCGESSNRQSLEGTVALDGVPLAEGHVTFVPRQGTKGPTAGGKITEGRFSILPKEGTFPGTFLVEITALRKTGQKVMDPTIDREIDEVVALIPERYNRQSELTAEVTAQGPNRFEFNLNLE